MTQAMRIRAQSSGDKAIVRVLISHEMESGLRRDADGQLIPAWYIQEVEARLNGQPIFSAHWGPSVSRNPTLQFSVKGARIGDSIRLSWKDNRGESRSDEATVY